MKEIVVLSGKGGTGKTSIVGSFAVLAENKVLADCDVDAPDLPIILDPTLKEERDFRSGQTAVIDETVCTECGLCQEVCRFGAIDRFKVDPLSCEGCGFCSHVCPAGAISMQENLAGNLYISDTAFGRLIHARLGITQENSGKLVAEVRKQAKETAQETGADYIITDGPPGTGCPVISSLSGASLALLVTEPTLSGLHDLERIISVCEQFGVRVLVCVNKYDINEENTRKIEDYCLRHGKELIARIPYDDTVTEAMVHGKPVVVYTDNEVSGRIEELWGKVLESIPD